MYKYALDKSSKKFLCPSCQKKRFVRYVDIETGQYISDDYGRCDREVECGYQNHPQNKTVPSSKPLKTLVKPPFYIDIQTFNRSLSCYNQNNLVISLQNIFTINEINKLIKLYRIGTSKKWPGATIYWQISSKGKIGQGKILLHDPMTGKRVKDPFPHISSVHSELGKKDQKPELHFFGEHLLPKFPKKPVSIVESEKTAIIMAGMVDICIWVATGGLSNLNAKRLLPFKGRKIILYPDLGAFEKWNCKIKLFKDLGYDIIISTLLEQKASEQDIKSGFDIADYFLYKNYKPTVDSTVLKKMITKNKNLRLLIDIFDLVL